MILHPFILSGKILIFCFILFIILGLPLAILLSKDNFRLKWLVETIVTLPLVFPPVATGFLLLLVLGRNSFLGQALKEINIEFIFHFPGLVLAGFIAGLPLFVKPVQSAIAQFPTIIKEASYIGGKSKIQTYIFVIFPNIKKSIIAALLIACARSLGEVGITLMLGGNIIGKTDTLSLSIFNAVFDGEYELAMFLSMILIGISLLFFIILHFLQRKKENNL